MLSAKKIGVFQALPPRRHANNISRRKISHSSLIYNPPATAYDLAAGKMNELLAVKRENVREGAFTFFDLEKGVIQYIHIYKKIFRQL